MMALPALSAIFSGTAATSTYLSLGSAILGGVTSFAQASAQASIAETNAAIMENNAVEAIKTAGVRAQDQDQEALSVMGQLSANQGASGLSSGSGSHALARKSAAELARRDRARITEAGQVEARNFRTQAQSFRKQAAGERSAGIYGLISAGLDVGTSLISSATTVERRKHNSLLLNG